MANICFNDITMVGDKAILQRLHDDIERCLNDNEGSVYRYGNELYPGSNYEGWFDDVGEVTKANEEEYFLRFTVDTKWTPAMDFFIRLAKDKGLRLYYTAEEPGCELYQSNDVNGEFYDERYVLYCRECEITYYSSKEDLVDGLAFLLKRRGCKAFNKECAMECSIKELEKIGRIFLVDGTDTWFDIGEFEIVPTEEER